MLGHDLDVVQMEQTRIGVDLRAGRTAQQPTSGLPARFAARSQSAMSRPPIAKMVMP
jgi:hypothetical protein